MLETFVNIVHALAISEFVKAQATGQSRERPLETLGQPSLLLPLEIFLRVSQR
jgi:hypothetical protein